MNLFGFKARGDAARRAHAYPPISRSYASLFGSGAPGGLEGYEAQARAGYLTNAVAQRAVALVADAVGSAPLTTSNPALSGLIGAASAGQDLLETLSMHLMLHGNAYVQVIAGPAAAEGTAAGAGDMVAELFALRPDRVSVEVDARGWPCAYLYRANGQQLRLIAEDAAGRTAVIHIKTPHPLDDHYGASALGAAAGAVAAHNAAGRWHRALLDNAARPSGALVYDPGEPGATLAPAQYERLKTELESGFQGAANAGRPMLLEGGLKWQTLSLTPAELDFAGLKDASAREIALAFGVPPMLLGLPGDATYANYREASRALWRLTVLPLAARLLGRICEGLQPWFPGDWVRVDVNQVTALADERAALWQQVAGADFLSAGEKRALLGIAAEGEEMRP